MKRVFDLGRIAAVAWFVPVAALANHHRPLNGPRAVSVPEIDASTGLLSLAAVATVLLFVWERHRIIEGRQAAKAPDN